MHATHCEERCHLHWTKESRRENPQQADTTENPMVEVNAVKNFWKSIKTQCYLQKFKF